MNQYLLPADARVRRPFLLLIGLALIAITAGCGGDTAATGQLLAERDLGDRAYTGEMVGEFTLAETAVITIDYAVPNIDTNLFDLRLVGPDGAEMVLLHSEGYRTDAQGGGSWSQSLAPGRYQLLLTATQGAGTFSAYWQRN